MSTFWLKMIGTTDQPWPNKPYHLNFVGFRGRKPSGVHRGDRMVLYAVGGSKRIFAICEVTSEWYECKEGDNEGWPYRVDVVLATNLPPRAGVDAVEIFTSEDELRRKVGRRSHVALTQEQWELAAEKLKAASP